MRSLLLVLLLALAPGGAGAATLDPARSAAIDQAAAAFLAKAAAAKKSGMLPRQADPTVAALLDTVFDTRDLRHGALDYADIDRLQHWLARAAAVGEVYAAASRAAHDAGLFGPEMERFYAAAVVIMQAVADCMTAEIARHAGDAPPPDERRRLDQVRSEIAGNIDNFIGSLHDPGLTVGAVEGRLTVLIGAAPSFARLLTPDQIERLRRRAVAVAAAIRDKRLRGLLGSLATALAAPPPVVAAARPAVGESEIALERDGENYLVPARIDGAVTAKFLVDSGAEVVALPKDLVERLTEAGTIGPGDMLGATRYVAADGKRHKTTALMLRRLEVGGHTATDVTAVVAPAHSEPLLGQSFLDKFKSWTLDNKRHVLVITE